jgi:Fur family ferric uptake transcriptional regulator
LCGRNGFANLNADGARLSDLPSIESNGFEMLQTPTTSDELARLLRSANQRATPQRLMILSVLQDADNHLTADEVFQRLGPMSSALNRSTVYRTLERFRDDGIVSETDLGGGVRVFELLDRQRHHHLICRSCEKMIEMDDDAVEALRSAIRAQYGFEAQIDHLAVWGECAACGETDQD